MLELPWEARWVVLELPWIVLVALVLCFLALGCDVLWWSSLWTEFDCWPLKTTSGCFPLTTWKCPVLMALNVTSSPLPTFPILMWRLAQLILMHNNPFPFLFLLCCWSRVFMVPSFFPLKYLTYIISSSLFKYCSEKIDFCYLLLPGGAAGAQANIGVEFYCCAGLLPVFWGHTGILALLHHLVRQFWHCHHCSWVVKPFQDSKMSNGMR